MRKRSVAVLGLVTLVALLSVSSLASADEKVAPKPGTITLKILTIEGKVTRPSVVVEVARARPEIKLSNLQDPAAEKTVRAATRAPF
jgi:hypothetical protein